MLKILIEVNTNNIKIYKTKRGNHSADAV